MYHHRSRPFSRTHGSSSAWSDSSLESLGFLGPVQSSFSISSSFEPPPAPPTLTDEQRAIVEGLSQLKNLPTSIADAIQNCLKTAAGLPQTPFCGEMQRAFSASTYGNIGSGGDGSIIGPVQRLKDGGDTDGIFPRDPAFPSSLQAYFDAEENETFARKVFVGGLPIDVSEQEITGTFSQFGRVLVDWPRRPDHQTRALGNAGYVFLVFEEEAAVQRLVAHCHREGDRYYLFVSSPTMKDKPVQVRPWRLADADYMPDRRLPLDPRRTVFIGGVPRPIRAAELAVVLDSLYGGVCYVGIDTDPELKYPKGAARVSFSSQQSFISAITGRFVHIPHAEAGKRVSSILEHTVIAVEIKPYVMEEQICDECLGAACGGRYATLFCGHVTCLQYYCDHCWTQIHTANRQRHNHKPIIKLADQGKQHMEGHASSIVVQSAAASMNTSFWGRH